MELVVEHVTFESLYDADNEALTATGTAITSAAALLMELVPEHGSISLVVTGDFVTSVRARSNSPDEAANYTIERGAGVAAARTMPQSDGIAVILPSWWFEPPAEDASASDQSLDHLHRTIHHEARHVRLHQRTESTHGCRARLGRPLAHGYFVASAGVMLEEYRAEAAVNAAIGKRAEAYIDSIPEALDSLRESIVDGITLRYPDEPPDRLWETAHGAVHVFGLVLAYLAAELRDPNMGEVPAQVPAVLEAHPGWRRIVGNWWTDLAQLFSVIPDADTATSGDVLDPVLLKLADALRAWLQAVGFDLFDTPGGLYFDVQRHDFNW